MPQQKLQPPKTTTAQRLLQKSAHKMNFGLKMKIFKSFNFIVLLTFSSLTWAVTPVGSWQLTTTTQMALTTATGKTVKSKPLKGFEFATFQADG